MPYTPLFFVIGALIVCFPQPFVYLLTFLALWRVIANGWRR